MKNAIRIFALILSVVMCLGVFAGCGKKEDDTKKNDTPLVVGYSNFSSKFSPFFAESAYDQDAYAMTQVSLLNTDRRGEVVMKGIKGETLAYNGTDYTYYGIADCDITEDKDTGKVYYDFVIRDDVKFSDGEPLTIDDVIFSMYVLCDPTYDGSSTLFALPIEGMEAYRKGMSIRYELILADGEEKSANGSDKGYYTAEQAKAFWAAFKEAGNEFAQSIVDYCIAHNAGTDVATAAPNWGFNGVTTVEEFFNAILKVRGYKLADINEEKADTSFTAFLTAKLDDELLAGVQTGESAANISGIVKTGANSLRVTLSKVDAVAIYQLAVSVAPMHYYGDKALYDYDNNKFGFTKGDLSIVRSKTTQPMGAGPYKFIKFENGVINYEANDSYYLGAPKTKYVNFKESLDDDKLNGVITGTIDITDPAFNKTTAKAVMDANKNNSINGSVITTSTVDNLGYGYIGMSANVVRVGTDGSSKESKDLRKAIATVFALYRDVSVDSFYGDAASVINYPISNTSWAAPQPSDDGYQVAFSVDVDGKPIYTSGMSDDEKKEAAKTAALGYLAAAGYTIKDGKATAAPKGASLEYEMFIPADGKGNHPSFMCATLASDTLAEIGIKITVNDLSDGSVLWDKIEAEQCAIWAAAWGATVDPDMFQIYHPDGGSNYMYDINDKELTELIMAARSSLDTTYRKAMYKACLDIIVDWAVEIPVYQRQNAVIFSTERVDMSTVTKDITTFYGWMSEIEKIEMNANK